MTIHRTRWSGRKYAAVIRAQFVNMTQFAMDFGASIALLPISLTILLYVFRSIMPSGEVVGGYTANSLAVYYIGVSLTWQVLAPVSSTMWQSWQDINSGDLSVYLCRPLDYMALRYSRVLAPALINISLSILIHGFVSVYWTGTGFLSVIQFSISVLLSFSTMFSWWFFIGALSFWWERPFTFRDVLWNLITLFSGSLVPVDLLHPVLQSIAQFLPFRGLFFAPAGIFSGHMLAHEVWGSLAMQALWLIVLVVVSQVVWRLGLRSYDGRGG